jgi:PAS domain S-box-containing protein
VRARSGEEAMRRLRDQDFAAVLLDLHMPGMDGIETARLIRAQKRSRETPILFITADASELSAREAYSLGAVDFIVKPFRTEPLVAKLAFFIELHRSRRELRDAERQAVQDRVFLSAVLEAVEDAIVACDPEGRLTLLNRAARDFLGLPADDGLPADGRLPAGVFRHKDGTPMPEAELPLQRALAGERVHQLELVLQPAGKEARPVVASGQALHDGAGRMLGAVVSLHDVSASLEAQLLRESRERLAESDRRKTEFLATLAHELRNPLAPISNGLHLLRRAGDEQAHARALGMMERQLRHMVHLVDDLLDIARISSNKVELRRERLDLATVLAGAVETSTPLIESAGHTLEVRLPEGALHVEGDATRLAQVVSNLLNNAAKYTPHGGRVRLWAVADGGEAVIHVEDSGTGIPADALPKVFEMFTQVGRGINRAQGGLGIGLALVKRLVELHGGRVEAHSEGAGRGSRFTVRLPLAQGAPGEEGHAPAPGGEACGASLRVMVVDDNVDAAESLAALLEIEGHVPRIAHDGEAALRVAAEFRPRVVFLDIGMPGKDGYQVARELRAHPGTQAAVLVALTGWGAQEDRARSRSAGFDHHLTKPASLASVEALLAEIAGNEAHDAVGAA